MSILYIVSTPIGNLEDISRRALRILSEVDFILCEDTRVTWKLLKHYGIKTPTISYHQHSKLKKVEYVIQLLNEGKNLALVSDAGTPGISDPGGKLVEAVVRYSTAQCVPLSVNRNASTNKNASRASPDDTHDVTDKRLTTDIKIVSIPGPSAITAAASVSGFPMDKFLFLGFPPHKKKRKKFFEEIAYSKYPVIFYESPHRIVKTLQELKNTFHVSGFMFQVVVCRELTKKFETIYRGHIEEVIQKIERDRTRGEFAVIILPR